MGLIWLIVIGTSIWVLIDTKTLGVRKGVIKGFFNMGPLGWFLGSLHLWIVVFPAYIAKRGEYKRSRERNVCSNCKSDLPHGSRFCLKCGNTVEVSHDLSKV